MGLLEQLQLRPHPHQLQPHHLDVVPHNGPQTNGVMMKTTMLIAIMMEALAVPMLSEDGTPTVLIVNARIQIMLRTVLTFGQPRSAKEKEQRKMNWTEINLSKFLFINFSPSG